MPRLRASVPLAVALWALPVLAPPPATAATVPVAAVDFSFQPTPVTVTAGDEVVWTNNGAAPHNVTAADGSFASTTLTTGQAFARTFAAAGTFAYYCTFHGTPTSEMAGVVEVQPAQATTTTTTTSSTTTAQPGTTSTTASPVTTTTVPGSTATTQGPAATTPTTASASVLSASQATGPAGSQSAPLSRTGVPTLVLAGLGVALVGSGGWALRRAKKR